MVIIRKMGRMMAKRKKLNVVAHYMMIGGQRVLIDPYKTDLPDRCKLVLAKIFTGEIRRNHKL